MPDRTAASSATDSTTPSTSDDADPRERRGSPRRKGSDGDIRSPTLGVRSPGAYVGASVLAGVAAGFNLPAWQAFVSELVIGVGNRLRGDDSIGLAVAERLRELLPDLPERFLHFRGGFLHHLFDARRHELPILLVRTAMRAQTARLRRVKLFFL